MKNRTRTDFIVIHCAATRPEQNIGAAEIRRWHRQKGWLDIGYHYVIRRNGDVEVGREPNAVGAHVEGFNHCSIGICMVGGVNANDISKAENNFTPEQFKALEGLLVGLKMPQNYPDAKIIGHRDLDSRKACPSFDVAKWVGTIDLTV